MLNNLGARSVQLRSLCERERSVMDIDAIKAKANDAIRPLKQPGEPSSAYWISCTIRTGAGDELSEAYYVFPLLVDLLGFEFAGRSEKLLWSIPVELNDISFFIEHRKFGLGIFAPNIPHIEESAGEIVRLIDRGIRVAGECGYFEHWVRERSKGENVMLVNDGIRLHERYLFFLHSFQKLWDKVEQADHQNNTGDSGDPIRLIKQYLSCANLRERAAWAGQSAIDCFFSWTEHIFVHLAVLLGKAEVNSVAKCNKLIKSRSWSDKYESVFDIERDDESRKYLNALKEIRELRNFASHGHFGRHSETLWVPTRIGCVPFNVQPGKSKSPWRHDPDIGLTEHKSLQTIEKFIDFLWSGARQPARILLQETSFPTYLKFIHSEDYSAAMESEVEMKRLVEVLGRKFDIDENMDF